MHLFDRGAANWDGIEYNTGGTIQCDVTISRRVRCTCVSVDIPQRVTILNGSSAVESVEEMGRK
jgi:hypothetical protein